MIESNLHLIIVSLISILFLWFSHERGLSLMMFFQQEEYDTPRFIHWLKDKKGFDKAASLWLLLAIAAGSIPQIIPTLNSSIPFAGFIPLAAIFIGLLHGILRSRSVRENSKKPLVKTQRVKRILNVYYLLLVGALLGSYLLSSLAPVGGKYSLGVDTNADTIAETINFAELSYNWQYVVLAVLLLILIQSLPFLLTVSNKLLEPAEERVKAKFRNEAIEKFNKLQPKVIAITGSFGKTSTKHILSHILGSAAPTIATPGSVNTDMGITRVIRESLKPEHQYFIVEMGAYGPGSIARLCKLTPPDVGLITAVGAAHYERFKSLETVANAKFELAEAVFDKSGDVVVSTDGIPADLLSKQTQAIQGNYIHAGKSGDLKLVSSKQISEGLVLEIQEGDEIISLKSPLFGDHQCDNILLAAACARSLGLPWSAIKGALATTPQIKHRLEVGKVSSGPTLINDAYNSNPVGFASALETLDVLYEKNGRRILITPGMVELGAKHDEEHERLGKLAAKFCDIAIVVTPSRVPTFLKGLHAGNDGHMTILTFDKQEEAETWAKNNWREGDAVLFENNLPDLYEAEFSF